MTNVGDREPVSGVDRITSGLAVGLPSAVADPSPAEPLPPRWSWLLALGAGPFTPARTALATDHLPFWKVLLIHLTAILLLWPIIEISYRIAEPDHDRLVAEEVWRALTDGGPFYRRQLLVLAVFAILAELGMAASGLLVSPWGARDEPLRTTLWRGLRRGFAVSGAWPVCLLLILGSLAWMQREYGWGDWSPGIARSWVAENQHVVSGLETGLLWIWVYWVVLRCVGAGRPGFASQPPVLCAECGYDIQATAAGGLCPECAAPVADSLNPNLRPGTPWECRARGFAPEAYGRTVGMALRWPWLLGRRMQVTSPDRHHRHFMLISLLITAGTLWLIMNLFFLFEPVALQLDEYILANIADLAGVLTGGTSIAVAMAGLIGGWLTLRGGRPLMHVAMRAAAYTSPLLVLWAALAGVQLWTAQSVYDMCWQTAGGMGNQIMFVVCAAPHLLMASWYGYLTWRIIRGAQYATC